MGLDPGSINNDGFLALPLAFELRRHRLLAVQEGSCYSEDLTQRRIFHRLQRLWQIEREELNQENAHDLSSDSIVGMLYSPTHRATQPVALLESSCLDFFSIPLWGTDTLSCSV